jgi:hypothetical protein
MTDFLVFFMPNFELLGIYSIITPKALRFKQNTLNQTFIYLKSIMELT